MYTGIISAIQPDGSSKFQTVCMCSTCGNEVTRMDYDFNDKNHKSSVRNDAEMELRKNGQLFCQNCGDYLFEDGKGKIVYLFGRQKKDKTPVFA